MELVGYYEQCHNKGKGDKAKYRGPNKDAGAQKHDSKVTEMRVRVTGVTIAHFTLKVIGGSCLANATKYSRLKKKIITSGF